MYAQIKFCVLGAGLALAAAIFGCATAAPPRELAEAQQEFQKAATGPAAKVNPAGLLQAKKALDRATLEFQEHPNAPSTRDFAYVALRRAQLAEVQAETLLAAQEKVEAERQMKELQARRQTSAPKTRQQLAETGQQTQAIEQLRQERELARDRRDQRERTTMGSQREGQQISAKLANIASVRQEPRGIVIAFPDSALFSNGRSTLKPSAKNKLNQVAAALADGEGKIVIEGHTDAVGSNRLNAGLSERRAITVRDYLRGRGISPERMTAVGFGGTRPLASDSTPQGRAKNRRVEIVVQVPAALSTG